MTPAHCDFDVAYTAPITMLDPHPDIQETIGPMGKPSPSRTR